MSQACFILKSAELPSEISFSEQYKKQLRAACRQYGRLGVKAQSIGERDGLIGFDGSLPHTQTISTPLIGDNIDTSTQLKGEIRSRDERLTSQTPCKRAGL